MKKNSSHGSLVSLMREDVANVSSLIKDDASEIAESWAQEITSYHNDIKTPNVLITGATGAGKSSIINEVFGCVLAEAGSGTPVTQHFSEYSIPGRNIKIFDSKGLEHGDEEIFIQTTLDFFGEHHKTSAEGIANCIHAVWYIVNSATARFEPFEESICRSLFGDLPLIFLLNKSDISSDATRDQLRKVIQGMELKHVAGIIDTVTGSDHITKNIEVCPNCGSDDLFVRKRLKQATCEDCGHVESLTVPSNLDQVVDKTVQCLPSYAREAFVASQTISVEAHDKQVKLIVKDFYRDYHHFLMTSSLQAALAKMLVRIAILWEFKGHGSVYSLSIARDIVHNLSAKDKLKMVFTKGAKKKYETTALGILWNRSFRALFTQLLTDFADEKASTPSILEIFDAMNEKFLDKLVERIKVEGLDSVLDTENLNINQKGGQLTASMKNSIMDTPNRELHRDALSILKKKSADFAELTSFKKKNGHSSVEKPEVNGKLSPEKKDKENEKENKKKERKKKKKDKDKEGKKLADSEKKKKKKKEKDKVDLKSLTITM